MTKTIIAALALSALASPVFAAAQTSHMIREGALRGIHAGMSQSEVQAALGTPENSPTWASGKSTWSYRTAKWNERADVDFGRDGKVTSATVIEAAQTGNS